MRALGYVTHTLNIFFAKITRAMKFHSVLKAEAEAEGPRPQLPNGRNTVIGMRINGFKIKISLFTVTS